jgi:hypothetical protein
VKRRATVKPGWSMSALQAASYWRLWAAACAAQGWPAAERESQRKLAHTRVFVGPISAKDINKTDQFDAIKAEFERLASNINHNEDKARKRILHEAGVALAELNELVSEQWLVTFLKKGFGIVPGIRDVTDLDNDQLRKLIIAATGRTSEMREQQEARDDKEFGKAQEIDEDERAGQELLQQATDGDPQW